MRVVSSRWLWIACAALVAVAASVAACGINPQPLPPGDDNGSSGGGAQVANPPSDNGATGATPDKPADDGGDGGDGCDDASCAHSGDT